MELTDSSHRGTKYRHPPSLPASGHEVGRKAYADESRKAGEWAARKFGRGKNYMTVWGQFIYFMDGVWTPMPIAGGFQTIQFAINNKVDLVAYELDNTAVTDTELQKGPPGFTFVDRYRSKEFYYILAFYRLNDIAGPETP